ncbi:MAG: hypothetical protein V3W37_03115 [Candidatus Binatia bacterium]
MPTFSQLVAEDLTFKSYRKWISQEDRLYIDSRSRNWDFYNRRWVDAVGRHCSAMCKYFTKNVGEMQSEFEDKHKVTLGVTSQIVKSIVDHIYGLGLSRTFPDPDGADKADAEAVKQIEKWVGGQIFFAERMQTMAEVTGTACVVPRFNERTRKIQFGLYGGEYVTPWYELGDVDNLLGFEIEFFQDRMTDSGMKRAAYYEMWDNRMTPEWPAGHFLVTWGEELLAEGANPYFPLLPMVPFRAEVNPRSWYGTTPIDAVVDANIVLNEYLTEFKEIVDFQGFSMLVIKGKVPGEQQISAKRTIDLIPGGPGLDTDAKYISPGAPLAELLEFIDWWITWTANQAQVPVGLINATVAKVESGYALTIRWKPFTSSTARKRRLYSASERDLWEVALEVARVWSGTEKGLLVPLNPTPDAADKMLLEWNEAVVPTDPKETRDQEQYDVQMGFVSPLTIYLKKNPDMSEKDAEQAMIKNIEAQDKLRAMRAVAQAKILGASAQFAERDEQ